MKCAYRGFPVTYRQGVDDLHTEVNHWLFDFDNVRDVKVIVTVDPTTNPSHRADIDLHVFVIYED